MNRTVSLALALGLSACSTLGSANGLGLLDVQFALSSSQTARAAGVDAVDADGAPVTVEGGTLHLERIDFHLPAGGTCDPALLDAPVVCDLADDPGEGDTVRIEGPITVDLANGETVPALQDLTVPAGTYESIRLRLDADSSPDGLSITAFGTVDAGTGPQPWSLGLELDEDARFEAVGGVVVDDATTATVLLDVAVWFAELPVTTCLADGLLAEEADGTLRLDDSAGCDLEDALEDAIGESGRVEDDTDDDAGDDHGNDGPENETENETENHGPEHD